jgi:hypothetical protein
MDTISFQILEDGTITVKTTEISSGNHMSADNLMVEFDKMMGGQVTILQNPEAKGKAHLHHHEHAFAGGHSHDGGKSFHNH